MIEFLRWAHILGATILIGTGMGIAFFMLMAHRTRDAHLIAHTAGIVVIADWIFTASAVIIQPVTGTLLALRIGWPLNTPWLMVSVGLYIFIGLFWLPVVWIQHRLRHLAREADRHNEKLSASYFTLFRIWFLCGIPAFLAILLLLWLMVSRPAF